MFSTYERLLKYSQSVTPRPEFVEVVIDRIAQEERRAAWRQSLFLFAGSLGSLGLLGLFGHELLVDISQSGFIDLSSLVLSDVRLVMPYWQDYVLSLLETLPAFSAALALAAALASFTFLTRLVKNFSVLLQQPWLGTTH